MSALDIRGLFAGNAFRLTTKADFEHADVGEVHLEQGKWDGVGET